jgi:signal transduction histidine kinase/CheY-like chemotaxis protein
VDVEAAQRRLAFLAEASTQLAQSLDYETTLQNLARLTVPELADLCVVDVVSSEGSIRRVAVAHVDPTKEQTVWEIARRWPLTPEGRACVPTVLRTGTAQLHAELETRSLGAVLRHPDHVAILRELRLGSAMIVPLVARGQVLGAISLASATAGRHYGPADLALAEDLARRAALAVDNARLFGDSQARLRETQTLLTVSRTLSSTLDPTEQVRRVAREIGRALSADTVGAYLADPAHEYLRPIAGYHVPKQLVETFLQFPFPIKGHLAVEEAWATRRALWSSDVAADPRVDRASCERFPHQSALFVPMVAKDEPVGGFFVVWWHERHHFTPEEIRLVEGISDQAGMSMDHARLYTEAEQRRREAEELARVARVLTETLDVTTVGDRIVASVLSLFGAQSSILRLRQSDGSLVAMAVGGPARDYYEPGHVIPAGWGVVGRAAAEGRPVFRDVQDETDFEVPEDMRRRIEGSRIRTILAVPLRVHDEVVGVLSVGNESIRTFSPSEVTVIQAFADQAALALENARLYQRAQAAFTELSRTQTQLVRAETLRALGELASGAAHHLNNLLAVILGRLQMARARREQSEVQRLLAVAEGATLDAAEVVRRMGSVSRAPAVPAIDPVDLNAVVQEVMELTRPRWHDEAVLRGVRIDASVELGSIPRVLGDAPSLREALMNLVMNAIDALSSDGRIVIKTWATDARVYCAVSDTGIGMPETVQRRALEPFFSTKGLRSTGLGLSVTYGIVQRSGGELTLDTAEGRGTTITFHLPAAPLGAEVSPRLPPAPVPSLQVLLIDDQVAVLAAVSEMLSELGATVLQARGGGAGLALLEKSTAVDVVLTDLGMPGMTGWAVARAVKARYPSLPVGLITGWGKDPQGTPDDRAAVDFILTKPLTVDTLSSALACVRRPNPTVTSP